MTNPMFDDTPNIPALAMIAECGCTGLPALTEHTYTEVKRVLDGSLKSSLLRDAYAAGARDGAQRMLDMAKHSIDMAYTPPLHRQAEPPPTPIVTSEKFPAGSIVTVKMDKDGIKVVGPSNG